MTRIDIRTVLIAGSWACSQHPADDFSDLDLILLTTNVNLYRAD